MYIIIAHIAFGGDSTPYRAVFHHNATQYLHMRPLMEYMRRMTAYSSICESLDIGEPDRTNLSIPRGFEFF